MGARSQSTSRFETVPARRQWLKRFSALASSTALPVWLPHAWAQSLSTHGNLPRIALVIGNTDYAQAPLVNPLNDAKAIGDGLQKLGFDLNLQLNASRMQLLSAIQQFGSDLASTQGVGFFYFTGHGAQHESRNYLIPVEAAIGTLADLPHQAVELPALLQRLSAARNPMNVIVLDACRANPFSKNICIAQNGLSQFDAPSGSLLAYATAPGHTAADGRGANGLYTQALLRELAVPETTIEDMFKRVRLSVRCESAGRQVPWQSVSLADDFYLRPALPIATPPSDELEQQFEEERAIWENARLSNNATSLERYLQRFPSGNFSELAQSKLERLLAQQQKPMQTASMAAHREITAPIVGGSIAPNPFSKGTIKPDANFTIGDRYAYRVIGAFSGAPRSELAETVTAVTDSGVLLNDGETIIDFLGNELESRANFQSSAKQFYPAEYALGKRWTTRLRAGTFFSTSFESPVEISFKIAGKETISVPAGTFDAFKIEGEGTDLNGNQWRNRFWVAPEISRRPLAMEFIIANGGSHGVADRYELIEFSQKITPASDGHQIDRQMTARLALCGRTTAGSGRNYC